MSERVTTATTRGPRVCPEGKHERMGVDREYFIAHTSADRRYDINYEGYLGHCSACGTSVVIAIEVHDGPPPGSRLEACGTCGGKKWVYVFDGAHQVRVPCDPCEARGVVLLPVEARS